MLPEDCEKGNPTAFMNSLLCDVFGADKLGSLPLINIAHHTGPRLEDGKSRCMIARLFSLERKRLIMRLAGESGNLIFHGKRIRIYPDLTADLVKRRALFNEVQAHLRDANVRYGLLFPCKLIVTFANKTMSFTDHKEAMVFYDQVVNPTLHPGHSK